VPPPYRDLVSLNALFYGAFENADGRSLTPLSHATLDRHGRDQSARQGRTLGIPSNTPQDA
jgi:hypothetical protein